MKKDEVTKLLEEYKDLLLYLQEGEVVTMSYSKVINGYLLSVSAEKVYATTNEEVSPESVEQDEGDLDEE